MPAMTPVQVAASADDGRQAGATWPGTGTFSVSNSQGYLGKDSANFQLVALRFPVAIPQGATINEASISFNSASGAFTVSPIALQWACEAVDNAAALHSVNHRPYEHIYANKTTAVDDWTINTTWADDEWCGGPNQTDPNSVVNCLQEIILRPGWVSGNYVMFICYCKTDATTGRRYMNYWDATGNDQGPILYVPSYTEASGIVLTQNYYRRMLAR